MRFAFLGAMLMVAGIAARIVAPEHRPIILIKDPTVTYLADTRFGHIGGWPTTTYDLVRIGGWALLIFGAIIIAFSLLREMRRPNRGV